MTSTEPFARVVVPSKDALTPDPAWGAPVVRTGGQYWTQLALLQFDAVAVFPGAVDAGPAAGAGGDGQRGRR